MGSRSLGADLFVGNSRPDAKGGFNGGTQALVPDPLQVLFGPMTNNLTVFR